MAFSNYDSKIDPDDSRLHAAMDFAGRGSSMFESTEHDTEQGPPGQPPQSRADSYEHVTAPSLRAVHNSEVSYQRGKAVVAKDQPVRGPTRGISFHSIFSSAGPRLLQNPSKDRGMLRSTTVEGVTTYLPPHREDERRDGEFAIVQQNKIIWTPLMCFVCFCLLLWEFSKNDWEAESLAANPSYGPSSATLLDCGAKKTSLILDGEGWRLVSAQFLHAGVVHYIFNMVGLLNIGIMLERVYGWRKVGVIYMLAGFFGTTVSAVFLPDEVMVGASGAIFGVFGGLWADLVQNWGIYEQRCQAFTVLLVLTAINLLLGLMPYLDNFAHIGGLVMGFFLGLVLLVQRREDGAGNPKPKKCHQLWLQSVGMCVAPVLLAVFLGLLFGKVSTDGCGWCRSISCVEFPSGNPWWRCGDCYTVGFSAQTYSNGTVQFTCPDTSLVTTNLCSGTSKSLLSSCCESVCT